MIVCPILWYLKSHVKIIPEIRRIRSMVFTLDYVNLKTVEILLFYSMPFKGVVIFSEWTLRTLVVFFQHKKITVIDRLMKFVIAVALMKRYILLMIYPG